MAGLGRVYKRKDSRFWWIELWVRGKRHSESSKSTRKLDAVALLERRVEQFRLVPGLASRFTLGDLVAEFVEDAELRGIVNVAHYQSLGDQLETFFGLALAARDLDTSRIRDFQLWLRRQKGYAPGTINLKIRQLRAMLRFGARNGRLSMVPESPPRLLGEKPRQGILSAADFRAILAELPGWAADVFEFAYFSGWRRNEILNLAWTEVDLPGRVIRLEAGRSKNRHSRICPIVGRVGGVLERRRRLRIVGVDLVFHRDGRPVIAQTFYQAFRPACARVGRPGVLLHDCRRSCITALIRAGVPERVAMQLSGHRTRSVFDRYNIVAEAELADAAEKLNRYVLGN